MLALTSATGKLGKAVVDAVLENKLIDPAELVVCVSQPTDHFNVMRQTAMDMLTR
jgi:hypothetical protein